MFCSIFQPSATNLRADIVEEQLGTSRASNVNTAGKLNCPRLVGLAVLEVREIVLELADIVVHVELRLSASFFIFPGKKSTNLVRVGLALGMELIDRPRSNLEVLHTSEYITSRFSRSRRTWLGVNSFSAASALFALFS